VTPALPPTLHDRRRLLRRVLALPALALAGCAGTPWPTMPAGAGSSSARNRLQACAASQGLAAWRGLHDINVGYSGEWQAGLSTPAMGRGPVEQRMLPGAGLSAQARQGPAGQRQVLRRQVAGATGEVRVWVDGRPVTDPATLDTAALVADGHHLFLAGTMALADFAGPVNWGPPEDLDGRRCDQLMLDLAPGLGLAPHDRLSLFVDRDQGWLRRLRLSLQGLPDAPGMVAEVDLSDHVTRQGVVWPRRFAARLRAPLPGLAAHGWQLTGLDLDRGWDAAAISGPTLAGAAAAPARALGV